MKLLEKELLGHSPISGQNLRPPIQRQRCTRRVIDYDLYTKWGRRVKSQKQGIRYIFSSQKVASDISNLTRSLYQPCAYIHNDPLNESQTLETVHDSAVFLALIRLGAENRRSVSLTHQHVRPIFLSDTLISASHGVRILLYYERMQWSSARNRCHCHESLLIESSGLRLAAEVLQHLVRHLLQALHHGKGRCRQRRWFQQDRSGWRHGGPERRRCWSMRGRLRRGLRRRRR